jgi:hypothetical protein
MKSRRVTQTCPKLPSLKNTFEHSTCARAALSARLFWRMESGPRWVDGSSTGSLCGTPTFFSFPLKAYEATREKRWALLFTPAEMMVKVFYVNFWLESYSSFAVQSWPHQDDVGHRVDGCHGRSCLASRFIHADTPSPRHLVQVPVRRCHKSSGLVSAFRHCL